MKKIASSLLAVLVLAAAATFVYRCHVAADRLRSIAAGEQRYRALGFELVLSAPEGGVQGRLRFQPYLDIPQVRLSIPGASDFFSLSLGRGRLKAGLWDNTGLRLVLDAGQVAAIKLEFEALSFELEGPDRILGLRAKSLRLPGSGQDPQIEASWSLQKPWLQLRPGPTSIPAQLHFRLESATWEKRSPERGRERLQVGVTEWGYALIPTGEAKKWRAHFRGRGIAVEGPKLHGELRPWNLAAEGSVAAGGEASRGIFELLSRLRPRFDRLDMHWGGLEGKFGESWSLELEPLDVSVRYLPEERGYGWKTGVRLKAFALVGDGRRFELSGLTFDESLRYRGLSYDTWLERILRDAERWLSDPARFLRPSLSHWPDRWRGKLGWKRLAWAAPGSHIEHREGSLEYGLAEEGLNFRMSGGLDSQFDSGFPPRIQDGKFDFRLAFLMPYRELLAAARARPIGESAVSWFHELGDRKAGLDWGGRVDFGPEAFSLVWDLAANAELGAGLEVLSLFGAGIGPEPRPELPKFLLEKSEFRFRFEVGRLSRLQAALEKVKSGASSALGLVGVYGIADPKADRLSLDLKLEEGGVFLNGKRNSFLEAWFKKTVSSGR